MKHAENRNDQDVQVPGIPNYASATIKINWLLKSTSARAACEGPSGQPVGAQ